jgi:quinol monooxygenase YgiN
MSVLQSRAVVAARPDTWEEAKAVARQQVENANTREGTLVYEIYVNEADRTLINLAAYRDADAWLTHVRSNPFSTTYMTLVDLVSLEVHGEPTPELQEAIAAFGAVQAYPPV